MDLNIVTNYSFTHTHNTHTNLRSFNSYFSYLTVKQSFHTILKVRLYFTLSYNKSTLHDSLSKAKF